MCKRWKKVEEGQKHMKKVEKGGKRSEAAKQPFL